MRLLYKRTSAPLRKSEASGGKRLAGEEHKDFPKFGKPLRSPLEEKKNGRFKSLI